MQREIQSLSHLFHCVNSSFTHLENKCLNIKKKKKNKVYKRPGILVERAGLTCSPFELISGVLLYGQMYCNIQLIEFAIFI